jgi:hypothetical protein
MNVMSMSLPWAMAREGSEPAFLGLALESARRAGWSWAAWPGPAQVGGPEWLRRAASSLDAGRVAGLVLFTPEPAWWCVLANRCPSLRAAVLASPADLGPLQHGFGPNLLLIAGQPWTYFECQQLLGYLRGPQRSCPLDRLKLLDEVQHANW